MFRSPYAKSPQLLPPILRNFCDLSHFWFLQSTPVIIAKCFSSDSNTTISNQKQLKETSFTISYLIDSCRLSPEAAKFACKKVQFMTAKRPDSFLALLNKQGFSHSEITKIVKSQPQLLLYDSEKIIFPKLKFFSSIGMTGPDITKIISFYPLILTRSLRNQIIPVYKFLKSALLFGDELAIKAISRASRIFLCNVENICAPNLLLLREIGMPQSVIQLLLIYHSSLICYNVDKFRKKIKQIIDMGICPTETKFIHALCAVAGLSESTWQHRVEVYGRYGWSKDEIMLAFKKYPNFMLFSEKKIVAVMDFLINVMEMKPSQIAAYPHLFSFSVKKRTIPRGLVIKTLNLKGVSKKNVSFLSVLMVSEERFLKTYVDEHREQIPYLQDVYEGRMCPQELGFRFEYVPAA